MTISSTLKLGCVAALAMTLSLQGWSATRFSPDKQPLGSIAPLILSDADLSGDTSRAYRPWFENGAWQGDLVEYTVTKDGDLSTSVDFTKVSPTNAGSNWSALDIMAKANAATYWNTGRKIITRNGTTQVPFRFTDAGIGATNKRLLDPTAADGASKILNFVRGDRSNEYPNGTKLRHRTSILGDIIHSKPVYVGPPNDIHTENNYSAWAAARKDRAPRVYVGANDGMLHVFDATTGKSTSGHEVYAYIPSMLISKLRLLTARPYGHAYYVDGELTVRDAYFKGNWHTLLVGSLGAGGRGFFGLDITDPNLSSESANSGNDKKILFEFNANSDNDLGDSFSRPVIAKLNDGKWYVVIGNGYNSVNGVAILYLVNLENLALTKLSTSSGSAGNPNGLSSPSLLDTNRDGKADYVYAGDIDGNLWKFDLSDPNPNEWGEAYGRPLHPSAGDQAITMAPQVALHPRYGYMVYFATGRLFTVADLTDTSVQSLYGIWDSGATPPSAANQKLLAQIWDGPKTYNYTDSNNAAATRTIAIYNPDQGTPNWDTQHGWKVDFPAGGYRVLQPVQVRANRVKATVYKPVVKGQGENWLVEAVLADGGPNPSASPIYDLNVDGYLTTADLYNSNPGEGTEEWHVPMMWRQVDGIMSQVTIAYLRNGEDTLFINFLQQTVEEPCTGDCPEGFQGGHIDVDTWLDSVALGGKSSKHDHEYDKMTGRVYLDYFDLNVPKAQGEQTDKRKDVKDQIEINSTGTEHNPSSTIDAKEEFIVLVANADLSPGSTLQIGKKKWNVLEYQRQIHDALVKWDPTIAGSVPRDAEGEPLVFTWQGIVDSGGTISHNFDDLAILAGGLHPTQTGCVNKDATGDGRNTYNTTTKVGRWRNGALTTQLVKKSYFTTSPAIAMVDIQKPIDLLPSVTLENGDTVTTTIDYNGDKDFDDPYEQVGGLLARSGAEHIWESTLFWHFGQLLDVVGRAKPCYGEPGWKEAVEFELNENVGNVILTELGYGYITTDTLKEQIQACATKPKPEHCKDLKLLEKLYERLQDYIRSPEAEGDSSQQGDGQTPVAIKGGGTGAGLETDGGSGGLTEGANFEPGRMSWTDIVN